MTDFSTPRRMSPGAFVIMFLKSFKDIVGAAFVALVYLLYDSHDSGGRLFWKFALTAGVILTYSLAVAFTRYYFRKFHIEGDKLIYTRGLAEKQTTSIPLSRIHTLRTKRGLVYRLLSMRGVAFDTLASDKQEVELILDERDWQMLLERVSKGENFAHITDDSVALPPPVKDDTRSISNLNILKGALCQNHLKGFAVLATVTLALFDKVNQIDDNATDRIIEYIGTHAGDVMPTAWQCLCLLVAIYLIVMALWTSKIALRYGNMTLRMTDNLLTIESGLVSRFTCRLAREKTTVLTIKRNPLEKIAGCQTISLHQAENATDNKNEGGIRIYGSNLGDELLAWWLGNSGSVNDTTLLSAASGIGLLMRTFIPHLLLAVGGAALIMISTKLALPGVMAGAAYAAIAAVRAAMAWKHSSIELKESYMKINRGNIACIREYIRYRDIQLVAIASTPFTPYTGRVSLNVSTNAGCATVSSLAMDEALAIRNYILDGKVGSSASESVV